MGVKVLQTNFTSGVIDPLAWSREDLEAYFNGAKNLQNLIVQPLGGVKRRGGFRHICEVPKKLDEIDLSSATVTAPSGGTAGNVHDDDDTTYLTSSGNIGTTNPFVLVHVDFGSAKTVLAVDLINYKLSSSTLDDELYVQYSADNSSWSNYDGAINATDNDRSRRRRVEGGISARYWRFARIGTTSTSATLSLAEIKFFEESDDLSDARLFGFAKKSDNPYMMSISDNNIDVISDDDLVASVSTAVQSDYIRELTRTQSRDTMLLFHNNLAPERIFRQGSSDEFDFRPAEFTDIPSYDYGAGIGGTNEVQVLNDGGTLVDGDKFTVLLEGNRTTTITASSSRSTTASNIQSALRALNNTSPSGISVSDSGGNGFSVTFSGDDGKQPWSEMSVSVNSGNSVWSVSKTTEGQYEGEDIFSSTRGYPACGVFYQSRLAMGGIEGVPNVLLESTVSEYFNFDINSDLDTKALMFSADTDQVSEINILFAGRHLTMLTSDAEFYIADEPHSENVVLKLATRVGCKPGVPAVEVDGAIIFVQADGSSLREFIFVDTEQNYQANNISKLASHLIVNPVDMALRKAVNSEDMDLILICNADGSVAAYSTFRTELVQAFSSWDCSPRSDKFISIGVDKQKKVYAIIEREINGTARRFVEILDEDLLLDGGGSQNATFEEYTATAGQTVFNWTFDNPASADLIGLRLNGVKISADDYGVTLGTKTLTLDSGASEGDIIRISSMISQISGLDHLAGETVQTYIDGSPNDDATVSAGGVLTLPVYADTQIQYGFFFDVYINLMDLRLKGGQTLAGQLMRVYRAILSFYQTGHAQIRANKTNWFEIPFFNYDTDILDASLDSLLFDGEIDLKGLSGWGEGGSLEIRQTYPAPINLRAVTREVSV